MDHLMALARGDHYHMGISGLLNFVQTILIMYVVSHFGCFSLLLQRILSIGFWGWEGLTVPKCFTFFPLVPELTALAGWGRFCPHHPGSMGVCCPGYTTGSPEFLIVLSTTIPIPRGFTVRTHQL